MKKIYQIIVVISVLFFVVVQKSLAFGQVDRTDRQDITQALSGSLACFQVNKRSTKANLEDTTKTTKVVIRSQKPFRQSTQPWYIIDGVPQENDSIFNKINSKNIESITVLKDSAATALCGSRGKNGVIIITLKKEIIEKEVKEVKEILINIFPNPTSEFVNIDFYLKEKSEVEIIMYNLQTLEKHEVSKEVYQTGKQKINWNIDSFQNGIYNIKIKIGNQVFDRKLIIQN